MAGRNQYTMPFGKEPNRYVLRALGAALFAGVVFCCSDLAGGLIDDLEAHWTLDETGGSFADASGNGHTGTAVDNPYGNGTNGKLGGAISLDGVNDYVTSSIDITGFSEISWSMWAKRTDSFDIGQRIFSLQHSGGDDVRVWHGGTGSSSHVAVDDGTAYSADLPGMNNNDWNHLAGTFDGSTVRSYKNGALENETAGASFDFNTASGALAVGANANGGTNPFEGLIDDVYLWSRAIELNEVRSLYNGGDGYTINPTSPTVPDSAWTFDNGTATDAFGSADGTAVGDPSFTSSDVPLAYSGNRAVTFDGDDYFGASGFDGDDFNFAATDPFSVALWLKADNTVSDVAVGKMDHNPDGDNGQADDFRGWYIRASGGAISFMLREDWNGNATSSNFIVADTNTTVVNGTWIHVLATYDGSQDETGFAIYIDGVEQNDLVLSEGTEWTADGSHEVTTGLPFGIASRNGGVADAALVGMLDEVAIWEGTVLDGDNALWLYRNSVSLLPEPASVLLFLVGTLAGLFRRRRPNRQE
jgi:hypothetical protein